MLDVYDSVGLDTDVYALASGGGEAADVNRRALVIFELAKLNIIVQRRVCAMKCSFRNCLGTFCIIS